MLFSDSDGIQTHNLLIRSQMLYSVELRSRSECDLDGIQTHNLLIRSQMLYSVELRSHFSVFATAKLINLIHIATSFPLFFIKGGKNLIQEIQSSDKIYKKRNAIWSHHTIVCTFAIQNEICLASFLLCLIYTIDCII